MSYYGNRAAAKTMIKSFRSAIDDCRLALAIDPSFGKAYLRAGKCFLSLGDFSEARRQLKEAEKLEPGNKTIQQELENVRQVGTSFSFSFFFGSSFGSSFLSFLSFLLSVHFNVNFFHFELLSFLLLLFSLYRLNTH